MSDEPLYTAVPAGTPYLNVARYAMFKDEHRNMLRLLSIWADADKPLRLLDVGCANGELLYKIKQHFPRWQLSGVDFTAPYLDVARTFEGLTGVSFQHASLFDVEGHWDVVLCTGVVEIFNDPQPVLLKLLDLVAPVGVLLADGRFNPEPVDVRIQFRDRSMKSRSPDWRTDWNVHSQMTVREILDPHVSELRFEDVPMEADLPFDTDKPAVHTRTFRDRQGRNLQTNGALILKNKQMLIAHRGPK